LPKLQLLIKDNLLLLEAICSSVLSHIEDEADVILPELVRYMLSTHVATDIIVRLIRTEVLSAVEEGTILRGNEVCALAHTLSSKRQPTTNRHNMAVRAKRNVATCSRSASC
jgi:hypothetical protein